MVVAGGRLVVVNRQDEFLAGVNVVEVIEQVYFSPRAAILGLRLSLAEEGDFTEPSRRVEGRLAVARVRGVVSDDDDFHPFTVVITVVRAEAYEVLHVVHEVGRVPLHGPSPVRCEVGNRV